MAWYRRFVVCWESFVPGGPIGAVCWESFVPVRSAGFRAGRVLSRSSGETARSEGVRGLRGMYLRCRRAAARLESGARPAGPGRASRRRAERSSRRGRRAGGQASRRTEVWRGAPHGSLAGCAERSSLGWRLRCRWSWSPDRRVVRGLQGLAGLRGDAPSEARGAVGERAGRPRAAREVWRGAPHGGLATGCLADGERAGRPRAARRSGRVRDRAPVTGYCAGS